MYNIRFVFIALIHFYITTFTDTLVWRNHEYWKSKKYLIIKFVVLILLILFWQGVANYKKNPRLVKYFLLYFALMFAMLMLTWPGNWQWDEFGILNKVKELDMFYWQHWLTSIFYMFALAIVPFPGGIVLMEIFLISLIVGFIIDKVADIAGTKAAITLFIPLCLPVVIVNNLYPMRNTFCAYLELLLFFEIIIKCRGENSLSWKSICEFVGLTVLVSTWRSESIICIIAIPVLIFMFFKQTTKLKKVFYVLAVFVFSFFVLMVQKAGGSNKEYALTGILGPLVDVIESDYSSGIREEDLEIIDRVVDVDKFKISANYAFWEGLRDYTDQDLEEFNKTAIRLIATNPVPLIKGRIKLFIESNGMVLNKFLLIRHGSSIIYDNNPIYKEDNDVFSDFSDSNYLNQPIHKEVRKALLRLLDCQSYHDIGVQTLMAPLLHNALIPMCILAAVIFIAIRRKQWLWVYICVIILGKTGLIILTAPIGFFMYYFMVYVVGYMLGMLYWITNNRSYIINDELT